MIQPIADLGFPHRHGGTPIAGWFIRENPIRRDDDSGYPHFRKPPFGKPRLPMAHWGLFHGNHVFRSYVSLEH